MKIEEGVGARHFSINDGIESETTQLDREIAELGMLSPERSVRLTAKLVNKIGVEAVRFALDRLDRQQGTAELEHTETPTSAFNSMNAKDGAEWMATISDTLLEILENNGGGMEDHRLVGKVARCHSIVPDRVGFIFTSLTSQGRIVSNIVNNVTIVSKIY
jgi:hypothetical protein